MNDLASFEASVTDDVVVGVLAGEVDLSNAAELDRAITDAVPNSAKGLVLDLSGLSYIDSSGIRLVLALAGSLRWRGQELVISVPEGSACRRVLDLAGIAVTVEATEDAALARFGAGSAGTS